MYFLHIYDAEFESLKTFMLHSGGLRNLGAPVQNILGPPLHLPK